MKKNYLTGSNNSLADILCCINFNHSFYGNIEFLKKLYGGLFHIAFYGPDKASGVNKIDSYHGYFAYVAVLDAIKRYPNYRGYIFVNDDCIINVWNFFKKNKNKIWIQPFHSLANRFDKQKKEWCWFNLSIGMSAYNAAFCSISAENRARLNTWFGSEDVVAAGPADFFYLPKNYSDDFINLFEVFYQNKVFIEMSIPTGLRAIANKNNIEILNCYNRVYYRLPGIKHNEEMGLRLNLFYSEKIDVYHPLKMSVLKNRMMILRWFNMYFFKKHTVSSTFLRILDKARPFVWFWIYLHITFKNFKLKKARKG